MKMLSGIGAAGEGDQVAEADAQLPQLPELDGLLAGFLGEFDGPFGGELHHADEPLAELFRVMLVDQVLGDSRPAKDRRRGRFWKLMGFQHTNTSFR